MDFPCSYTLLSLDRFSGGPALLELNPIRRILKLRLYSCTTTPSAPGREWGRGWAVTWPNGPGPHQEGSRPGSAPTNSSSRTWRSRELPPSGVSHRVRPNFSRHAKTYWDGLLWGNRCFLFNLLNNLSASSNISFFINSWNSLCMLSFLT